MHAPSDVSQVEHLPSSRLETGQHALCLPASKVGPETRLHDGRQDEQNQRGQPERCAEPHQFPFPLWPGLHRVAAGQEVVGEGGQEGEEELSAVRELDAEGVGDVGLGEVGGEPVRGEWKIRGIATRRLHMNEASEISNTITRICYSRYPIADSLHTYMYLQTVRQTDRQADINTDR